jgi:hypothetical protein
VNEATITRKREIARARKGAKRCKFSKKL